MNDSMMGEFAIVIVLSVFGWLFSGLLVSLILWAVFFQDIGNEKTSPWLVCRVFIAMGVQAVPMVFWAWAAWRMTQETLFASIGD